MPARAAALAYHPLATEEGRYQFELSLVAPPDGRRRGRRRGRANWGAILMAGHEAGALEIYGHLGAQRTLGLGATVRW